MVQVGLSFAVYNLNLQYNIYQSVKFRLKVLHCYEIEQLIESLLLNIVDNIKDNNNYCLWIVL